MEIEARLSKSANTDYFLVIDDPYYCFYVGSTSSAQCKFVSYVLHTYGLDTWFKISFKKICSPKKYMLDEDLQEHYKRSNYVLLEIQNRTYRRYTTGYGMLELPVELYDELKLEPGCYQLIIKDRL